MVSTLDDLNEESRSILNGLCEQLEQVALLVVVDEDLLLADDVDVFLDFEAQVLHALEETVIVRVRNFVKEFNTTLFHFADGVHNIVCAQSDMLDAISTVVFNILLDLTLSATISRFIYGHLDVLIEVSDDDGAESRELSVHHLVIHRPEAMEVEHSLIP